MVDKPPINRKDKLIFENTQNSFANKNKLNIVMIVAARNEDLSYFNIDEADTNKEISDPDKLFEIIENDQEVSNQTRRCFSSDLFLYKFYIEISNIKPTQWGLDLWGHVGVQLLQGL